MLSKTETLPTKVSLVFDDGFTASCHKIASIFEVRGLRACFAVLVEHDGFMPDFPKADFELWNALQERGHTIHPHGFDHTDLTAVSHSEAVDLIDRCLASFEENLKGFDASKVIYHLTYNKSTPEVDEYLLGKVAGIRTTGLLGEVGTGVNGAEELETRVYTCSWDGPDCCDEHLMSTLKSAVEQNPALMMYMLHGLDEEGWGPISTAGLERALDFIIENPSLEYTALKNSI